MAAGGYYANDLQTDAFRELLELCASPPSAEGTHIKVWDGFELYLALLLLYTGGVAATAAENWSFLTAILRDSLFTNINSTSPLALKIYPWAIAPNKAITTAALHDGQPYYEPIAEWLYTTLSDPLKEYLPLDFKYAAAFHRFEVLSALAYVDVQKQQAPDRGDWVPLGRFAVMHRSARREDSAFSAMRAEYDEQGREWAPIKSGILRQPDSSYGTSRSIDTVGYNFDVIDEMIGQMSYI